MNLGEMRETLARDVLNRDDVDESLTQAIRFTHTQIQRDYDWRAMEVRKSGLTYPAGELEGITVDDNYKRAREVYIEDGGQLRSVLPSTEADVNKLRRIAYNARGITNPTEGAYIQRWFEVNRKVVLFITPGADLSLTVDYVQFLEFYADENAEDYFSTFMSEVLVWGAAFFMSKYIQEDNRAELFEKRFIEFLQAAQSADMKAKMGGTYTVYRPTLANEQPGKQ